MREPSLFSGDELKGQARVLAEVRRLVDEWRGFPLGPAAEPYPDEPARYAPGRAEERPLTDTTATLLRHWFRHEPHAVGPDRTTLFKYWPHQRRAVETFIYLYEVRGIRRSEDLWRLAGAEAIDDQHDPWAKIGAQMATGSGKTKIMSLVIAWSYLNALHAPGTGSGLGFGRHALVVAPNLFVRDRLLMDFRPLHGSPSVFSSDPVVPPEFDRDWNLTVYDPVTCPLTLEPNQGALVVTNFHQMLRTRESLDLPDETLARQMNLLFVDGDPAKLEAAQTPLLERFSESRGLLVINDEAHHVWDETGHSKFERKAREKATNTGEEEQAEMAWIRSIRRLHGSEVGGGRVSLQVDLSATLFEETGAVKKPGKGGKQATEFRPRDLFRHTALVYDLAEAIKDGIVKKPILERIEVKDRRTGEWEPLVRDGQPNAWEKYRNLLVTGIQRWQKVQEQLRDEGDPRKPILFILCNDKDEAREVANFLRYGEATAEDLTGRAPTGYADPETKEILFLDRSNGDVQSTVVEIHIGEKETRNENEWEKVRDSVNAIDRDEFLHVDERGQRVYVPNPYNVVVSVMMLKEGWDVRNVKVVVPLRPCDSRTLTEQTLGRGLRKMHPPILDDEGAAEIKDEELYVIEHPSFKAILDQIRDIIEERGPGDFPQNRDYVGIKRVEDEAALDALDVRLVRFEGMSEETLDWRRRVDFNRLPGLGPRLPWMEQIPASDIKTWLRDSLAEGEEEGLEFTLYGTPSYLDFEKVLEHAYVRPILRDLRVSFAHRTALKGVVRDFLEQKTFNLPAGIIISFDHIIAAGQAALALGNATRPQVVQAVRATLLPVVQDAIATTRESARALMSERHTKDIDSYQALKKNLVEAPKRTVFGLAAMDSPEERRLALMLDGAKDVSGWVYNHRSGVGYSIPYAWQGTPANYFPDFIVRAKIGQVFHNVIIEVKGRLDGRDKEKARVGRAYCELLTQHDREPWHFLMLIENTAINRADISWWEQRSVREVRHLLAHHETVPLLPDEGALFAKPALAVLEDVPSQDRYTEAVPVFDMEAACGAFSDGQEPACVGWAKPKTDRRLHAAMFVAKVAGKSMEPHIPDGAWGLFRSYPVGAAPAASALDGKRVVVQLHEASDPETGGRYTLKRWTVAKWSSAGAVEVVSLRPDNPGFEPIPLTAASGDLRVVAEFLEVVG
jgi:type III restriction enzyme